MDQWPGAPSVYFGTTGSGAARLTDEGARVGRKRSKVGVGYSAVVQQFVEQIKLANQCMRKALFTCVVYTKTDYNDRVVSLSAHAGYACE